MAHLKNEYGVEKLDVVIANAGVLISEASFRDAEPEAMDRINVGAVRCLSRVHPTALSVIPISCYQGKQIPCQLLLYHQFRRRRCADLSAESLSKLITHVGPRPAVTVPSRSPAVAQRLKVRRHLIVAGSTGAAPLRRPGAVRPEQGGCDLHGELVAVLAFVLVRSTADGVLLLREALTDEVE
jgi:hypothetical protein